MRFHTNTHTRRSIQEALAKTQADGRVASGVFIDACAEKGSRTADRAFEVSLRSYDKQPGDGRRRPNQNTGDGDLYAATWHEWGWFIAELLDADPDAVFGPYAGKAEFHAATDCQFAAETNSLIPTR